MTYSKSTANNIAMERQWALRVSTHVASMQKNVAAVITRRFFKAVLLHH